MERNDQAAIEALFAKLADVERNAAPRDPEADAYIRQMLGRQPGTPYYMAQTILVQEQALEAAQARIEALEAQGATRALADDRQSGGLLSGLFGERRPSRTSSVPRVGRNARLDDDPAAPIQPSRGSGFLAGAAQTAMGVAGGVLLGNAIGGLFGGNDAKPAEPGVAGDEAGDSETDSTDAGQDESAGVQDAGYDDAGFDDGGFGDMDI